MARVGVSGGRKMETTVLEQQLKKSLKKYRSVVFLQYCLGKGDGHSGEE